MCYLTFFSITIPEIFHEKCVYPKFPNKIIMLYLTFMLLLLEFGKQDIHRAVFPFTYVCLQSRSHGGKALLRFIFWAPTLEINLSFFTNLGNYHAGLTSSSLFVILLYAIVYRFSC